MMYINPHLEDRLADQRIQEALCVAKQDCLLRARSHSSRTQQRSFPFGLFLLPLVLILAPFQLGVYLMRRH
jgi:hypothetical protein